MPRKLQPSAKPRRAMPLPAAIALWLFLLAAFAYALTSAYRGALHSRVVKPQEASPAIYPAQTHAKFLRAVDGDTVRALIGAHEERVQLLGVDAPELFRRQPVVKDDSVQSEWQETGDPEAMRAKQQLEKLLKGRGVILEMEEPQRDRFGRLQAWVWVDTPQGRVLANEWLLQRGLAKTMPLPKGCKYAERMKAAGEKGLGVGG